MELRPWDAFSKCPIHFTGTPIFVYCSRSFLLQLRHKIFKTKHVYTAGYGILNENLSSYQIDLHSPEPSALASFARLRRLWDFLSRPFSSSAAGSWSGEWLEPTSNVF